MAKILINRKREPDPEIKPEEPLHVQSVSWENFTWVNIESPTEKDIQYLADNYHFHQLALDDCLSRKQIPKIDVYPGYLFFVFHFPVYDKKTRIASKKQWSAFAGENFLITLHPPELKTIDALFRDCKANEKSCQEHMSYGSGFLLLRILDRAVDSYFPVLDKILSLIEDIEDAVFDEEVEAAKELSILRRDIITQRAVMFPTRALFNEMENKLKRFSRVDITAHYNDLMDHMNKICDTLDEAQEIIEVFKDTDYTLATHRINRVTRLLTIFSTIVLPILVISSLYGMNVVLPGGLDAGSLHTFFILIIIMGGISTLMLIFFRRRRWI